jgi:phosphoglycerate dehydrogenase-like enzyme
MSQILIEEQAFLRLENDIRAIDPNLEIVLMRHDGSLSLAGRTVTLKEVKPEIAWLSLDLARAGLVTQYIQSVLEAGTVKWLQTFNAGLDQSFYRELFNQGIRITRSSAQAIAIAEYVIANVMVGYQSVFERKQHQLAHKWQRAPFKELWQTCWVIVGFGHIGQEIAKRVRAFEVKVIGVRRSTREHPLADTMITLDRLFDYLPQADVVVLACPLNEQTKDLANRAFFQRLKPGATFVNIARGKLVDQPALIEALQEGTLAHAVLDVFDPEPLPPDSPLWEVDRVTVTPHSSNAGSGTPRRGDMLFLENLRRFLAGEPLLNETNDDNPQI